MSQVKQPASQYIPEASTGLTDEDIIQFLTDQPDFFQRNPDILESLVIPHEKGEAISLVERQVNLLREKNQALEEQLGSLIAIARENNDTQQQIHQLMVNVLAHHSPDDTLDQLMRLLSHRFKVDHVAIQLYADDTHTLTSVDRQWVKTVDSPRQTLDALTPSADPLCGRLEARLLKEMFSDQADSIASSVLVPLRKDILHGFIALGSTDEHRFNPGMDTLYLKRLGELVAAALLRFIN